MAPWFRKPPELSVKAWPKPTAWDWLGAVALPLIAMFLFGFVEVRVLEHVVYLNCWLLWAYTLAFVGISISAMGLPWRGLRARQNLVYLVAVVGFAASFWLCRDAVGVVQEWQELRIPNGCVVQFPKNAARQEGVSDWPSGKYNWEAHNWNLPIQTRRDDFLSYELLVAHPASPGSFNTGKSDEFFDWMAREFCSRNRINYSRSEESVVHGERIKRVHCQSTQLWRPDQAVFVQKGHYVYILSVSSYPRSSINSAEAARYLCSLKSLD